MASTREERLARARRSLDGLSVGDALGQRYFMSAELAGELIRSGQYADLPVIYDDELLARVVAERRPPTEKEWRFTDDTQMALSILENLRDFGEINADELARSFSRNYDNTRGYGAAMHGLLPRLQSEDFRVLAPQLFEGGGSFGNGAAMRVAPLGAYFADDLDAAIENARRSAEVTHAHPEGVAGAIAVAVAAALTWRHRDEELLEHDFLNEVLRHVPASEVKDGIEKSLDLEAEAPGESAAELLGSGDGISAQDTVPFCLWCAAQYPDHYEEAIWLTLSGLGDRDTTCAIVGGIVALNASREDIPEAWLQAREPLPDWIS